MDAVLATMPKGWAWRRLTANTVSVYRRDPSIGVSTRFDGHGSTEAEQLADAISQARADSAAIAAKFQA